MGLCASCNKTKLRVRVCGAAACVVVSAVSQSDCGYTVACIGCDTVTAGHLSTLQISLWTLTLVPSIIVLKSARSSYYPPHYHNVEATARE